MTDECIKENRVRYLKSLKTIICHDKLIFMSFSLPLSSDYTQGQWQNAVGYCIVVKPSRQIRKHMSSTFKLTFQDFTRKAVFWRVGKNII